MGEVLINLLIVGGSFVPVLWLGIYLEAFWTRRFRSRRKL